MPRNPIDGDQRSSSEPCGDGLGQQIYGYFNIKSDVYRAR
jgi:hypothetical protein